MDSILPSSALLEGFDTGYTLLTVSPRKTITSLKVL